MADVSSSAHPPAPTVGKSRRGFASMDPAKQRAASSKGGKAPHTVQRGFALLDPSQRKEVALKGVEARRRPG